MPRALIYFRLQEENYYHTREVGKPGSNNVAMSVPDNEKTGNSLFDVVFAVSNILYYYRD